jgi:hypothetical protein
VTVPGGQSGSTRGTVPVGEREFHAPAGDAAPRPANPLATLARGRDRLYPKVEPMAYAEQSPRIRGPINEHASALAHEWRSLTRVATAVALLTTPAFFIVLYESDHIGLV